MKEGLLYTYDHCKLGWLFIDCHPRQQVGVSCQQRHPTHTNNLATFGHDKNDPSTWIFEDIEKCVSAMIPETVGYRQRTFVENLDEAGRISLGRGVHGSGRIDARDHDKGAPLDPGFAVCIDVIDHLGNLIWKIWPKNRFDLSGTRYRHLGLIHRGLPKSERSWPDTISADTLQSTQRLDLPVVAPLRHADGIEQCPLSGVTRKTFAQAEFFLV